MTDKSVSVAVKEFSSDYTTTVDTSFFNIIPSPLISAPRVSSSSFVPYIEYTQPHYKLLNFGYEPLISYYVVIYGFTGYSFIIMPLNTTNFSHEQVEIWMVNPDHSVITGYRKYFMKRTADFEEGYVPSPTPIDFYTPINNTVVDVYGSTWQSLLVSSMLPRV